MVRNDLSSDFIELLYWSWDSKLMILKELYEALEKILDEIIPEPSLALQQSDQPLEQSLSFLVKEDFLRVTL